MDYDLGRAHGKVVITADTRDATRAMGEYEKASTGATEAAEDQTRVEKELTERRRVATEAAVRRKEAEAEYKRVMKDSTATVEEQNEAEQKRNKTRGEHLQAARRAGDAERALAAEVAGNKEAVDRFIQSLDRSTRSVDQHSARLRSMRSEADKLSTSMTNLSRTLAGVFATLGKGLAITGGIGAAGGLAAILGAGGIQGTMIGIGGLSSVIAQFSGSLLLLPAVVGGAVASIATLAIAFKGVGEALGSMNDPEKFVESLKNMGPATKAFTLEIYQFRDVFRGFKQTIQDGLFAPLIKEMEPLIRGLLPTLMDGLRSVANAFGELGAGLAQWLRAPETVEAISVFLNNMATALKAMMPGFEAFSNGLRTLSTVGSSFFPQLARSFQSMGEKFSAWIDRLNASGELQEWIQNGINAFSSFARVVRDFGLALRNVFKAATNDGGSALSKLENLAGRFLAWTESVSGNKALTDFFLKVKEATDALMPILKVVGSALASVISTLTDAGIATQSGLLSFFTSLGEALKVFAESTKASAPQLNEMLTIVGQALLDIMKSIGPQLPALFASFAEVLKTLAPVLVTVVGAVVDFLASLSPEAMTGLVIAIGALSALGAILGPLAAGITAITTVMGVFGAVMGAVSLPVLAVIAAVAALVAIGILLYKNWDTIKAKTGEVWEGMKAFGSWLSKVFGAIWDTLVATISGVWEKIKTAISTGLDNVKTQFMSMVDSALDWGAKLIKNLGEGIVNSIPGLRGIVDWVAKLFPDSWETNSPAKRGPLSKVSPNQMGAKLVTNLAEGIKSAQPTAMRAVDGVASGVTTGLSGGGKSGFTGTGGALSNSKGGSESGLQSFVKGITQELSAWGRMFQSATQIALGLVDMGVNMTKIVGALWSDGKNTGAMGDNPLTRAGGILSDRQRREELPEQNFVDGVPYAKGMKEPEEFSRPMPGLNPESYMDRKKSAEKSLPKQKDVGPLSPTLAGGVPGGRSDFSVRAMPGDSSSRGGVKPKQFLVHTTESDMGAEDLAGWMKGKGDRSYHYIVGDDGKMVINPVSTDKAAWSVGPQANATSINAAFAGSHADWSRKDWIDKRREAIRTMATLAAQDADKYGIPTELLTAERDSGIGGHSWVSDTLGGTDHTDPGPGFPWDIFTADVEAARGGTGALPKRPVSAGGMRTFGPRPKSPGTQGDPQGGRRKPTKTDKEYGVGRNADIQYGAAGFPRWVYDLGDMFGVEAATYPGHQIDGANGQIPSGPVVPNPKQQNRGIDWRPKGVDIFSKEGSAIMERFMGYLRDNNLAEQVIYESAATGTQYGFPANSDYSGSYPSHRNHGHTRFGNNLTFKRYGGKDEGTPGMPAEPGSIESVPVYGEDNGVKLEVTTPQPLSVEQKIESVPEYGKDADGTPLIKTTPERAEDWGEAKQKDVGLGVNADDAGGIAVSSPGSDTAKQSPIDQISGLAGDAGTILGDAFQVFNSVLTNIDATADLTATAVRGFENTEDIYKTVDQIQTFISTAADIAKLTSSVTGTVAKYVGAGAAADPSGGAAGTAAAFSAASAIAGLVQTGFETTNAVIDLGQEAYRMASKYGAKLSGMILGGPETGPLGGNVRMLLNTNNGQIMAYSEDNPMNKSTKELPRWFAKSYGGNRETVQQQTQLNLYTGPGADPKNLIADTMWLANYAGAPVVSLAGRE